MAKAKRRLTNIRVREVSLVDEAANQRRFIVVKNKGGSGMGKKNADLLKDDDNQVLKLSANVQNTLLNRSKEVIEKMNGLIKKVEAIEVSDDVGDEVPGELIEEFDAIIKSMPQFANDEDDTDFGIAKAAEEIKKAGKKISASRLEKISSAFSILSDLLVELGHMDSGSDSSKKKTAKNKDGHDGGNDMTDKDKETTKRSPEVAFTLAEADLIKARESLESAEEQADQVAVTKAKEAVTKAEADFKVQKDAKDESEKAESVAKAQKQADEAAEALRKAKGDPGTPKGENADVLKQLLDGQKATQGKIDAVTAENAELKKKLEEVSKSSVASNSGDDNSDQETEKSKDKKPIEKGKAGKEFWGAIF